MLQGLTVGVVAIGGTTVQHPSLACTRLCLRHPSSSVYWEGLVRPSFCAARSGLLDFRGGQAKAVAHHGDGAQGHSYGSHHGVEQPA